MLADTAPRVGRAITRGRLRQSNTPSADIKTIRKILASSKKRNIASYDSAGSISNEELKQILATAESLKDAVQTWLKATHRELLKQ
jgi:hypothetical protein